MSVVDRAATEPRLLVMPASGPGTTDHALPSQCSRRVTEPVKGPLLPTAHTSFDDTDAIPWKRSCPVAVLGLVTTDHVARHEIGVELGVMSTGRSDRPDWAGTPGIVPI